MAIVSSQLSMILLPQCVCHVVSRDSFLLEGERESEGGRDRKGGSICSKFLAWLIIPSMFFSPVMLVFHEAVFCPGEGRVC